MREMSALQRGTATRSRAVSPASALTAGALLALGGCGGEPPETLGGFGLDLTQQEVMDAAAARGGFNCRLRATYPAEAVCEGPAEEGVVTIHVRGDSVVRVALRLEPADEEPGGHVGRFVDPFGDPAWRDRPHPPRSSPPEGYHTQWLDRDSVRGLALVCAGPGLQPPCAAELAETSPAGVRARLDTLLGIPR